MSRLNLRASAGLGTTLAVVCLSAGGMALAYSSPSGLHPAALNTPTSQPAPRATTSAPANRSRDRVALHPKSETRAKAAAAARAASAAKAAAQAKARAAAAARAASAAKAAAQAKARAAAAARAASTRPTYADNCDGWIAQARAVLAAHGDHVPSADAIKARAITESSCDRFAENHWDMNQALYGGTYGLLQLIKPTFAQWALPGHTDIMNPVDSIIAGVRYANYRYGDFTNIAYLKSGY